MYIARATSKFRSQKLPFIPHNEFFSSV